MTLDLILSHTRTLLDRMDGHVEAIPDVGRQQQADWAWFRLATILSLVRDRGATAVAASLARGLLEQAAYWDWAATAGVGTDHLGRWAAAELRRLEQVAEEVDDRVWLGWVLPPGAAIHASSGAAVPRNAADAVSRLGQGLASDLLEPFGISGLVAAHRLLDVLTHGNLAAAVVLSRDGQQQASPELIAAIVHIAAAGATAVVVAEAGPVAQDLVPLALDVAKSAVSVHGLPLGRSQRASRPARSLAIGELARLSTISRMPLVPEPLTRCGLAFMAAADDFVSNANDALDGAPADAWAAWTPYQFSWEQMQVVRGCLTGQLARGLLPYAARSLFEDGARWGWLRRRAASNPNGDSFRGIVEDAAWYVEKVKASLVGDGIDQGVVEALLGEALTTFAGTPPERQLPPITELVALVHQTQSGVESARPIYSILSQFVHSSPIALFHLRRDTFPTLTAPTYAVALEAACRGFTEIAITTTTLAGVSSEGVHRASERMVTALSDVIYGAAFFHQLG